MDDDDLFGNAGEDRLFGDAGRDTLNGGVGEDLLRGGRDRDFLTGGSGTDKFAFKQGESNSTVRTCDVITDWNVASDFIDSTIAGTSSNYGEMFSTANNIGTARSVVENNGLRDGNHAFL